MNILIVGCGRVGRHLVHILEELGHDVSVLAQTQEELELLSSDGNYSFNGVCQVGVAIDIDVLRQAGAENCDAVAAVCAEDNINIMVAEIAGELFHVPRVLARIADPIRKEVFSQRFGMRSVCPTNLTVEALLHGLLEERQSLRLTIGSTTAAFLLVEPQHRQIGRPLSEVTAPEGQLLFGILRANNTVELNIGQSPVLRSGDQIIFSCVAD